MFPLLIACAATIGQSGCTGSVRINFVPLGFRRIEAEAPLIYHRNAGKCYFWIDDKQQLCIAMTDENRSLLGEQGRTSLDVSIVLPGLPAGAARDYRVDRRTLRGKARDGGLHVRFASLRGIVAVWIDNDRQIHGRFRISTRYQKFQILVGWTATQEVLVLGEFTAVRDPQRGSRVLARTETDGMERTGARPPPEPVPVTGPPVTQRER